MIILSILTNTQVEKVSGRGSLFEEELYSADIEKKTAQTAGEIKDPKCDVGRTAYMRNNLIRV